MKLLLNEKRLLQVLQNFYTMSNIRVNISDAEPREVLAWPGGISHYCELVQAGPMGSAPCGACDRRAFEEAVARGGEAYAYTCHAGLLEVITLIRIQDEVLGYMMFGQLREAGCGQAQRQKLRVRAEELQLNADTLLTAYEALPCAKREWVEATAAIMHAVLAHVQMEEQIRIRKEPLPKQVERAIAANLGGSICIEDLVREVGVCKTTLCKSVKASFGCTVNELIRRHRMERAKALLQKGDLAICAVAERCGIADYNYFSKVFRQEMGVTPTQFQKLCGQQGEPLLHPLNTKK